MFIFGILMYSQSVKDIFQHGFTKYDEKWWYTILNKTMKEFVFCRLENYSLITAVKHYVNKWIAEADLYFYQDVWNVWYTKT